MNFFCPSIFILPSFLPFLLLSPYPNSVFKCFDLNPFSHSLFLSVSSLPCLLLHLFLVLSFLKCFLLLDSLSIVPCVSVHLALLYSNCVGTQLCELLFINIIIIISIGETVSLWLCVGTETCVYFLHVDCVSGVLCGNCLLETVFLFWCWQTYRQTDSYLLLCLPLYCRATVWLFNRSCVCGFCMLCVIFVGIRAFLGVLVYVFMRERNKRLKRVLKNWEKNLKKQIVPQSELTKQQEALCEWHSHIRSQEAKVMESPWRQSSQDLVATVTRVKPSLRPVHEKERGEHLYGTTGWWAVKSKWGQRLNVPALKIAYSYSLWKNIQIQGGRHKDTHYIHVYMPHRPRDLTTVLLKTQWALCLDEWGRNVLVDKSVCWYAENE